MRTFRSRRSPNSPTGEVCHERHPTILFRCRVDPRAGGDCASHPAADAPAPAEERPSPMEETPANHSLVTKGKLDEVTVYRGQALVTRLVEVPGPAGLREVVITDLPEHVQPASIYAENADGGRDSQRTVSHPPGRAGCARGSAQARCGNSRRAGSHSDECSANAILALEAAYLNKLEQFAAPTANAELTKGVLNAETLKTLTVFMFDQRQKISAEQLKLSFELRGSQRETQHPQSPARSAHRRLGQDDSRGGGVRQSQRGAAASSDCGIWSIPPTGSPRTTPAPTPRGNTSCLEYNASIEQMSGEDWNDVEHDALDRHAVAGRQGPRARAADDRAERGTAGAADQRLRVGLFFAKEGTRREATANRNEPQFREQWIQLRANGGFNNQYPPNGAANIQPQQPGPRQTAISTSPAAQQFAQTEDFDSTLNDVAKESQVLDLVNSAKLDRSGKPRHEADSEGVSVSYQLMGRTSLPSRSDRQLIQIASLPMKAEFYRVAIPVLTSSVYQEASVVNSSKMVLLAGPVSTYVAGQFVGHGDMPTVSIGESFTVGLGIDASLRAAANWSRRTNRFKGATASSTSPINCRSRISAPRLPRCGCSIGCRPARRTR